MKTITTPEPDALDKYKVSAALLSIEKINMNPDCAYEELTGFMPMYSWAAGKETFFVNDTLFIAQQLYMQMWSFTDV